MQGLVWGKPELAHEHDFDGENIIVKNRKFEVCNMEECKSTLFVSDQAVFFDFGLWPCSVFNFGWHSPFLASGNFGCHS